jgi:hypothetical protein
MVGERREGMDGCGMVGKDGWLGNGGRERMVTEW